MLLTQSEVDFSQATGWVCGVWVYRVTLFGSGPLVTMVQITALLRYSILSDLLNLRNNSYHLIVLLLLSGQTGSCPLIPTKAQ